MEERMGHCYELALKYALANAGYHLVHGYIKNPFGSEEIDHAWCRNGSVVYEPTSDTYFPLHVFMELFKAKEEVCYLNENLDRVVSTKETYGPWHQLKSK